MKGRKLAVTTRRQNWRIRTYFAHTVHFSCDLWHFRHEIQARPKASSEWPPSPNGKYPGSNADASRKDRARIRPEAGNVGFHQQTTPVSAGTTSRCSAAGNAALAGRSPPGHGRWQRWFTVGRLPDADPCAGALRDCSQVAEISLKRSHLVALRPRKVSADDPRVDVVAEGMVKPPLPSECQHSP